MTLTARSASPVETGASRARRMRGPALIIGGLAVSTLALRLRDPHQRGSWGFCPLALIGIHCPACGGLRAVNDLTHGHLLEAASSNLLFVASIPLIVFLLGRWALDSWQGRRREPDMRVVTAVMSTYGVLTIAFTLARNLPFGSWLAP